jgi:hypothetical protein
MSKVHSTKKCSFPGCEKPLESRGLCTGHANQSRRGRLLTPLAARKHRRKSSSYPELTCDEAACDNPLLCGSCHVFRYSKNTYGYGRFTINHKNHFVHRWVWELENGPIPAGMEIDHMCRNRACCNIDHLRLVTRAVNTLENSVSFSAINKAKTHCINGHPFNEENTRMYRGGRSCRTCAADYRRQLKESKQCSLSDAPNCQERFYVRPAFTRRNSG